MKQFLTLRRPVLLTATVIFLLPACGDDGGGGTPNQPPTVTITGGPPEGGEDSYLAEISWIGSDPDGTIDLYEVAVDPSHAFTLDEIGDPEGSGLTRTESPGTDPDLLVLTYSKMVDGETVSFDYEQTRQTTRTFLFETPDPDSMGSGGTSQPLPRFSGLHTVYVRARDDRAATSFAARLSYTAVTATPTSHLTRPILNGETLFLDTEVTFCWDGEDPDAPPGTGKPVAYEYKLVDLSALDPPVFPIPGNIDFVLFTHPVAKEQPWIRQDAADLCASFTLEPTRAYLFAVRAVDVAGAVEPYIDAIRGQEPGNAVVFQTLSGGVYPLLNVTEDILGDVDGNLIGVRDLATHEVQGAASTPLRFHWSASAESYGGEIEAFRFGADIPDLDGQTPPWTGDTSSGPIEFSPGIHTLTFQARDTDGNITTLNLLLRAIEFPFDREVLYVDDSRDGVYPRDNEHDDFWLKMLTDSGRFDPADLSPAVWKYDVHGDNDVLYTAPIPPELSLLGRYRMVFWANRASGYNGRTGLSNLVGNGHLASYTAAGGSLWLSGQSTVAAMLPTFTGGADFGYPLEVLPGTFPWDWLKLYSSDVRNDLSADRERNGLIEADPYPGQAGIWPALVRDDTKERSALRGVGIGNGDAVFAPIDISREADFRGVLEPVYVYGANGPRRVDRSSAYEGKLNAIRYHDPDPEPRQGPTVWFGFPMYYWYDDQAQAVVNGIIDWFREVNP